MIRIVAKAQHSLLASLRAHFGMSQLEMGRLLGVSQVQVARVEGGSRRLPEAACDRLWALRALLQAPELPAAAPDPGPLRSRQTYCFHQAQRLRYDLQYALPERARAARRRLATAETLPAALAAAPALPAPAYDTQQAQLTLLRNAAVAELEERSGPTPELLLRARLAGWQAEADFLARALGEPVAEEPPLDAGAEDNGAS
jgi:transcriptional regulator with XRE-family HTH domain